MDETKIENKLSEEEVIQTLEILRDALDINFEKTGKPFDFEEFSQGMYRGGSYTPATQQYLMKHININSVAPKKEEVEEALNKPSENEDKLVSFNQSFYFSSLMYKRNHEYLATLPSFDLEISCINAKPEDYIKSSYKKDYDAIKNFLNRFNYREQFRNATWNMLMNETYYGVFRKLGDRYVIQDLPWKYAEISGKWEYGLLYDFDMSWFLQPQVDLNAYPNWFKKQYNKMFLNGKPKDYIPSNRINKRTGSFGVWTQTDPTEGFWCFKFNSNHTLQVPFFSAMLPEMIIVPLMRNLQVNQSLAAARKLLVSEIPYLNEKKSSSVANQLAIDADVLGKFLGLATRGLEAAIKVLALPTENIKGVEFENTDKDTYKNFMSITSGLLSGGKVIFSSDTKLNAIETQLSMNLDEILVEAIYPQFENFLDYFANQETKKFKWKFRFVGSNDYLSKARRQKEATDLATIGVVLPNKLASAFGLNKIELERELEEAKATGFTDKLMAMINMNTMSSKSASGGRPQSDDGQLTDSGSETRDAGSNIEKGGNI